MTLLLDTHALAETTSGLGLCRMKVGIETC